MKPALQALLVAPDYTMRDDIHYGRKTISIREGHRDYRPGPVMLACHIVPWAVMADIISVRHCTLREVTEQEYKDDGFSSQEDLLAGLQKYYTTMTLNSPVTVIRWTNARGFWVDVGILLTGEYEGYHDEMLLIKEEIAEEHRGKSQ